MDVLTFETFLAVNSKIIKQMTSSGLSLFNYQDDARSNKIKTKEIFVVLFTKYLYLFILMKMLRNSPQDWVLTEMCPAVCANVMLYPLTPITNYFALLSHCIST